MPTPTGSNFPAVNMRRDKRPLVPPTSGKRRLKKKKRNTGWFSFLVVKVRTRIACGGTHQRVLLFCSGGGVTSPPRAEACLTLATRGGLQPSGPTQKQDSTIMVP